MAIGYTREGEIRAVLRSYELPEHEINRLLQLPDCRNNIAWVADNVAAWRVNQKTRIDILTSLGYSADEAAVIAKRFSGQPSLEWAREMGSKRDRPKNFMIFGITMVSGAISLFLSGHFQGDTTEIVLSIGGLFLLAVSVGGLLSLLPESKIKKPNKS